MFKAFFPTFQNYLFIFLLKLGDWQEALAQQPCGVASKNEQQGEAIAFGKALCLRFRQR